MADSAPPRKTQCAVWYRTRLGWPVEVVDGDVQLSLTAGLTAFEVPAHLAPRVLGRLRSIGTGGPALRTGHGRVAFLCDADDLVLVRSDMPLGVAQLRASARLVLPRPDDAGAWVVSPELDRGVLPSARAVLHAITHVTAAAACEVSRRAPVHVSRSRRLRR
ncbi:hypothetical protein [Saccharothrix sp. Mg75]|uniref:hypothetical protein n=1 Tax=Saccharothrix sp. Mg75 TaxID=3445357 RepID=UPI003EECAA33